jgi:poly-beta-1,6-N-acetyl-D-glucosamine synthase
VVVLEIIFWLAVALVFHTYVGYPLVLLLLRGLRSPAPVPALREWPGLSMIVSVFNEEEAIVRKLRNIEELDYPDGRFEALLGSDGSTDGTNTLLTGGTSSRIKPAVFDVRRGKVSVLNDLVARAQGEILVFCDANNVFHREALRRLAERFADPGVGVVCGEQVLQSELKTAASTGELSYWGYETILKRMESEIGTIIGATGAIYAVRRSLYRPLPVDRVVTDDLLIPLQAVEMGYQAKYEPRAISFEPTSGSVMGEFKRKVRIGASNFNTLELCRSLLSPSKGFVAFALWSHKVLRWLVPMVLLAVAATSIAMAGVSDFYFLVVILEILLVCLAIVGWSAERLGLRAGALGMPYYFLAMNAALLVGFFKFLGRKQQPTWETVR